ncbi:sugar porter family MFS transporter [Gluconacetobacter tumulicola]|uniref:Sugar porter family MFS transporter n=1 Tax=Gluconacetobacter tumulicola TaxID=1017177 RepID=A0A7W4P7P4_9PROT|nr:sugar porter family MFS transporter [Gluconacetobacter tumulicola]MBB2180402.1 sugar porter family MFS transporter [Gluconacetobacter tumulicola]
MKSISDIIVVKSERHDVAYVLRICAVAALGGILFGYDTSVISGAIGPLRDYFHLSAAETGWAVSNVVVGCIFGALASGWLAHHFGRRLTLFFCALLFSAQSVGAALAPTFFWFVIFRLIGGVAVGVASAVSPMYMSEVSPKDMRGRALSMEQFAIVFGQLVVFIVNYLIARSATETWLQTLGWRWMVGSEIVPCILFCATIFLIPESPRWHMTIGREEDAKKTLTRISNEQHALTLMSEIRESLSAEGTQTNFSLRRLFADRNARWIVFIGAMIAALQQVTGINVMMYYAPMVLKNAGSDMRGALFQTIWIGLALLIGSVLGAWIVDRKGRRFLMQFGSIGMILSLLVVSWALYMQTTGPLALSGMLFFMLMFGLSWGPVAWILISEIFPNRFRAIGMSIAVASNWVANFLVAQGFPMISENEWLKSHFHGAFSMWLFAAFGVFAMWFVLRFVPETKGISLEKIETTMMGAPLRQQAQPVITPQTAAKPR